MTNFRNDSSTLHPPSLFDSSNTLDYTLTDDDIQILTTLFQQEGLPNAQSMILSPASTNDSLSPLKLSIQSYLRSLFHSDAKPCQFLVPFCLDRSGHWVVLEMLYESPNKIFCRYFDTDGYAYPVDDMTKKTIREAFSEDHPFCDAQTCVETIVHRQQAYQYAGQKGVNCGLIVAMMIEDLRSGRLVLPFHGVPTSSPLLHYAQVDVSKYDDQSLRDWARDFVRNHGNTLQCARFFRADSPVRDSSAKLIQSLSGTLSPVTDIDSIVESSEIGRARLGGSYPVIDQDSRGESSELDAASALNDANAKLDISAAISSADRGVEQTSDVDRSSPASITHSSHSQQDHYQRYRAKDGPAYALTNVDTGLKSSAVFQSGVPRWQSYFSELPQQEALKKLFSCLLSSSRSKRPFLQHHQADAALMAIMAYARGYGFLLADQPGTGKTRTLITIAAAVGLLNLHSSGGSVRARSSVRILVKCRKQITGNFSPQLNLFNSHVSDVMPDATLSSVCVDTIHSFTSGYERSYSDLRLLLLDEFHEMFSDSRYDQLRQCLPVHVDSGALQPRFVLSSATPAKTDADIVRMMTLLFGNNPLPEHIARLQHQKRNQTLFAHCLFEYLEKNVLLCNRLLSGSIELDRQIRSKENLISFLDIDVSTLRDDDKKHLQTYDDMTDIIAKIRRLLGRDKNKFNLELLNYLVRCQQNMMLSHLMSRHKPDEITVIYIYEYCNEVRRVNRLKDKILSSFAKRDSVVSPELTQYLDLLIEKNSALPVLNVDTLTAMPGVEFNPQAVTENARIVIFTHEQSVGTNPFVTLREHRSVSDRTPVKSHTVWALGYPRAEDLQWQALHRAIRLDTTDVRLGQELSIYLMPFSSFSHRIDGKIRQRNFLNLSRSGDHEQNLTLMALNALLRTEKMGAFIPEYFKTSSEKLPEVLKEVELLSSVNRRLFNDLLRKTIASLKKSLRVDTSLPNAKMIYFESSGQDSEPLVIYQIDDDLLCNASAALCFSEVFNRFFACESREVVCTHTGSMYLAWQIPESFNGWTLLDQPVLSMIKMQQVDLISEHADRQSSVTNLFALSHRPENPVSTKSNLNRQHNKRMLKRGRPTTAARMRKTAQRQRDVNEVSARSSSISVAQKRLMRYCLSVRSSVEDSSSDEGSVHAPNNRAEHPVKRPRHNAPGFSFIHDLAEHFLRAVQQSNDEDFKDQLATLFSANISGFGYQALGEQFDVVPLYALDEQDAMNSRWMSLYHLFVTHQRLDLIKLCEANNPSSKKTWLGLYTRTDQGDSRGWTLLHTAVFHYDSECVAYLCAHHHRIPDLLDRLTCDLDDRSTALHMAVASFIDCSHQCHLNKQNTEDVKLAEETLRRIAAIVRSLVLSGCDPSIVDHENKTPLDLLDHVGVDASMIGIFESYVGSAVLEKMRSVDLHNDRSVDESDPEVTFASSSAMRRAVHVRAPSSISLCNDASEFVTSLSRRFESQIVSLRQNRDYALQNLEVHLVAPFTDIQVLKSLFTAYQSIKIAEDSRAKIRSRVIAWLCSGKLSDLVMRLMMCVHSSSEITTLDLKSAFNAYFKSLNYQEQIQLLFDNDGFSSALLLTDNVMLLHEVLIKYYNQLLRLGGYAQHATCPNSLSYRASNQQCLEHYVHAIFACDVQRLTLLDHFKLIYDDQKQMIYHALKSVCCNIFLGSEKKSALFAYFLKSDLLMRFLPTRHEALGLLHAVIIADLDLTMVKTFYEKLSNVYTNHLLLLGTDDTILLLEDGAGEQSSSLLALVVGSGRVKAFTYLLGQLDSMKQAFMHGVACVALQNLILDLAHIAMVYRQKSIFEVLVNHATRFLSPHQCVVAWIDMMRSGHFDRSGLDQAQYWIDLLDNLICEQFAQDVTIAHHSDPNNRTMLDHLQDLGALPWVNSSLNCMQYLNKIHPKNQFDACDWMARFLPKTNMRAAQLALEQMATRDDIKENTIRIIDQCMQNPYENSKFCGNVFVCRSLFFASLLGRKDLVYNCFTSFRTVQDFWANFSNCLLLAIRFNHESLVDALISVSDGALLAKGLRVLKSHESFRPSVEKMVKQQLIQACVYDRKSILVTLVFVYSQCGLIDCSQDFTDMNSAFCQAFSSGYNFSPWGSESIFGASMLEVAFDADTSKSTVFNQDMAKSSNRRKSDDEKRPPARVVSRKRDVNPLYTLIVSDKDSPTESDEVDVKAALPALDKIFNMVYCRSGKGHSRYEEFYFHRKGIRATYDVHVSLQALKQYAASVIGEDKLVATFKDAVETVSALSEKVTQRAAFEPQKTLGQPFEQSTMVHPGELAKDGCSSSAGLLDTATTMYNIEKFHDESGVSLFPGANASSSQSAQAVNQYGLFSVQDSVASAEVLLACDVVDLS